MKNLFAKYKHALLVVFYVPVYLIWFSYLEKTVTKPSTIIHTEWDDMIPFCEVFVIPYFLWFMYIAVVVLYCLFTSKDDYLKTCIFLFTGMTIFLVISTLWSNGHHLRPSVMPRDNIFSNMVLGLYQTDTPTNLWPSIHVYNSIGAHLAVSHHKKLGQNKWIRGGSFILASSIVLSTMFIKQHSVFDVVTAFIMAFGMYILVYYADILEIYRARSVKRHQVQENTI